MIGQLNIKMYTWKEYPNSGVSYGKKVRLATFTCEREECAEKISQFAYANPKLWQTMRKEIFAEWVCCDPVHL